MVPFSDVEGGTTCFCGVFAVGECARGGVRGDVVGAVAVQSWIDAFGACMQGIVGVHTMGMVIVGPIGRYGC